MAAKAEPVVLAVAEGDLDELRARLRKTRFPAELGRGWIYGADLAYMRELVAYWREGFDWRAQEARLNAFPQFRVDLDRIGLHFLHVEGRGPNPQPVLLLHGWPGSVFEFLDLIPRLTDPARFGGDAANALTVVVPSLPGYGQSFAPGQPELGVVGMADLFVRLMDEVLDYPRFAVQGGDWGAFIAARLGHAYPDRLTAIHLNMMPVRRDMAWTKAGFSAAPNAAEEAYLRQLHTWTTEEYGYSYIQGTRPQTLAYAMTDSPAGLAAWIVEKFQRWSGGGDLDSLFPKDHLLANISYYWFTGAIGSSFWPYYDRMHTPWPVPDGALIDVPTAYAEFPSENVQPPRSVVDRMFSDIRRWSAMPKGGHFAAFQEPVALGEDILAFFRDLRTAATKSG